MITKCDFFFFFFFFFFVRCQTGEILKLNFSRIMTKRFFCSSIFVILNMAPLRQCAKVRPQNTIRAMNYWPFLSLCHLCLLSSYIMVAFEMTGDATSLFCQGNGQNKQLQTRVSPLSISLCFHCFYSLEFILFFRIRKVIDKAYHVSQIYKVMCYWSRN